MRGDNVNHLVPQQIRGTSQRFAGGDVLTLLGYRTGLPLLVYTEPSFKLVMLMVGHSLYYPSKSNLLVLIMFVIASNWLLGIVG